MDKQPNPQKEQGHLDIANELADQFCKLHLSGNEWRILWTVIRKTYGWQKKEDRISLSQFEKATGLPRPTVNSNLKKLVVKKLLVRVKKGNGLYYSLNKIYSKWTSSKTTTSSNLTTTLVVKPLPKMVVKPLPTITNNTTNTKTNNVSTNADKTRYYGELIANELQDEKSLDFYIEACRMFNPSKLMEKAAAIIKDGGARNPGAVFTAWFKEEVKKKNAKPYGNYQEQIKALALSKSM